MSIVIIKKINDYDLKIIKENIINSIDCLGGMNKFISKGDRVLLKPNLLSAKCPDRNITTHPIIVEAIAEILIDYGVDVYLGDSPGGAHRGVNRVFFETGMEEIAKKLGIKIVNFEASGADIIEFNGYSLKISKAFLEFEKVINLPKLKTHILTLMTGAVKNIFGVVPGFMKMSYHKLYPYPQDFSDFIANLYCAVKDKIILNIVDGIWAMEGEGPSSGQSKNLGLMLISPDAVSVDYVCGKIIGYKDGAIKTTEYAHKLGGGDIGDKVEIIGYDINENIDFKLTSNWRLQLVPRPLVNLVSPLIWIRPDINQELCTKCGICENSCPVNAINLNNGYPEFDYKKCITCLCCHELCPNNAVFLERSILAKIFRK